ncbi:MAG: hypothetical protein MZV65_02210 [Chromatiales bacterium]|nr:hypothetical protein [Chromatiales bacterium]
MKASYEARIQSPGSTPASKPKPANRGAAPNRRHRSRAAAESVPHESASSASTRNLAHPAGPVCQSRATSTDRHITGFLPGRARPRRPARFLARPHRTGDDRQHRPVFPRLFQCWHCSDDEVTVEEAWFQTTGARQRLSIKGGRFLSGIGYQNDQHPHAWDFANNNLMYRALFGEGLRQRRPAAEMGGADRAVHGVRRGSRARRQLPRHRPQQERRRRLRPVRPPRRRRRRLATAGAPGVSYLHDHAPAIATARSTISTTWHARNLVQRQQQDLDRRLRLEMGARRQRDRDRTSSSRPSISAREEEGSLLCVTTRPPAAPARHRRRTESRQSGCYAQGVYQFMPRWRAGYRYDRLDTRRRVDLSALNDADSAGLRTTRRARHSLMLDYSPSRILAPAPAICAGQVDAERRPRTSGSCSTSRAWARMARTDSEESAHEIDCSTRARPAGCRCHAGPRRAQRVRLRARNGARWRAKSAATRVKVYTATTALQDPHRIEAQPQPDRADARAPTWWSAPAPNWKSAGCRCCCANPATPTMQPGRPGYFEAARYVTHAGQARSARPLAGRRACRRQSAHPDRPAQHRAASAQALAQRLAELDPANAAAYQARCKDFPDALGRGDRALGATRPRRSGACRCVVQHKSFTYLLNWLGMTRSRHAGTQARRRAIRSATWPRWQRACRRRPPSR